jgi:peptidoglycan/xylan/chitin deacetylase (PgdA/CDA1 family)
MIFHRVMPEWDPLRPWEPDAKQFHTKMSWVAKWFNVLPLNEAVARLEGRSLPSRPLAITFDDGYADNFTVAGPILKELGLPATCFVATGYLDGGRMFNDTVIESIRQAPERLLDASALGLERLPIQSSAQKLAAIDIILRTLKTLPPQERAVQADGLAQGIGATLPSDLMMTSAQVRGLSQYGFSVGAHTVTHPILSAVSDAKAWEEIVSSKEQLEALLGASVDLFAYPNGRPHRDYQSQHVGMVRRAGFRAAFSAGWGVATTGCDLYQLPRSTPWDHASWKFGLRSLQNLTHREYESVRAGSEHESLGVPHGGAGDQRGAT